MPSDTTPRFWYDPALPFAEARSIADGRQICYAPHSHESFSLGIITGGRSTYVNGRLRERVGPGAVVIMNPEEVHACNPVEDLPWSYRMLYLDTAWLACRQKELGFTGEGGFRPSATRLSHAPGLYRATAALCRLLDDSTAGCLAKEAALVGFVADVHDHLDPPPARHAEVRRPLARAAEFISDNFTRNLRLDDICAAAGLSQSHLIRAFKGQYGMTPHAYLINRRIQFSRARLRQGLPIADVALEAGFADQAHLQRAFKRHVAATPGQYRR